jgi:hypothetical protein
VPGEEDQGFYTMPVIRSVIVGVGIAFVWLRLEARLTLHATLITLCDDGPERQFRELAQQKIGKK